MKNNPIDYAIIAIIAVIAYLSGALTVIGTGADKPDSYDHYRAILIRNGVAAYKADEHGNPVLVITDREFTQPK